MAFTVREFQDLIRMLEKRPEWREALRRQVLTDDLLSLPQVVRELAEAQRQTQAEVRELAEAQRQTQAEVRELAEAQRQTQTEVQALAEAIRTVVVDVGRLKQLGLEQQYRQHAAAYLGRALRGVHTFSTDALARLLDQALDEGRLTREDRSDILLADVVLRGRRWEQPEREVYLVIEVSWGIGMEDVERAVRRAQRLDRVLSPAFPAVAGAWLTPDAKSMAQAMKVAQITDGTMNVPEGWGS